MIGCMLSGGQGEWANMEGFRKNVNYIIGLAILCRK